MAFVAKSLPINRPLHFRSVRIGHALRELQIVVGAKVSACFKKSTLFDLYVVMSKCCNCSKQTRPGNVL